MYRRGKEYDRIAKLAINIYLDYGFNTFPLDEKEVCRRLGIALVPYSECAPEERALLHKRSTYGFFNPLTKFTPPIIFYNDDLNELQSYGCIRQSIFHEIKHFVDDDKDGNPEDDDLAEYFGKYFACPIPHLIVNNIINPSEIVSLFGTSYTIASYVSTNIANRKKRYGKLIFDYEKPLIQLLDPTYYEIFINRKDGDDL